MAESARSSAASARFDIAVGVGGVGTGVFLALEGNRDLGRNESRAARVLEGRDYCKLHIVSHYLAALVAGPPAFIRVTPIAVVGDDAAGSRLESEMARAGIDVTLVRRTRDAPTLSSVCLVYPDGSGGNITAVDSAASRLGATDLEHGEKLLAAAGPRGLAISLPEVGIEQRRHLLESATRSGSFRVAAFTSAEIADRSADQLLQLVDLVALNQDEVQVFVGQSPGQPVSEETLVHCAKRVRELTGRPIAVLVSAGQSGAFLCDQGRWTHVSAPEVVVLSTAGAGDALLAGLLAAYAIGAPLASEGTAPASARTTDSALAFGVLLAAFSVTSPHSIHPDATQLRLASFGRASGRPLAGRLSEAWPEGPAGGPTKAWNVVQPEEDAVRD